MLPRKTEHADLERERSIFFEIGLALALGLVVFLMNLNFKPRELKFSSEPVEFTSDQEMVPITRQEHIIPPPAPPAPIKVYDILNIVEDNIEISEELEILNTETTQDEEIKPVDLSDVKMEEEEADMPIFMVVEDMPIFRPDICDTYDESQKELMKYIAESIRYPVVAAENGIQGLVFVSFVVSPKGKVTNVEILRGINKDLDKEAIRVVESLPDFSPGKQRGKPVRVKYSVPIRFVLKY